jgi:hypothetical protein
VTSLVTRIDILIDFSAGEGAPRSFVGTVRMVSADAVADGNAGSCHEGEVAPGS